MTKEEIKLCFEELKVLLKGMDVPHFRTTSIPWLARNLAVRNKDKPNFEKAMEVINKLHRAGVSNEL